MSSSFTQHLLTYIVLSVISGNTSIVLGKHTKEILQETYPACWVRKHNIGKTQPGNLSPPEQENYYCILCVNVQMIWPLGVRVKYWLEMDYKFWLEPFLVSLLFVFRIILCMFQYYQDNYGDLINFLLQSLEYAMQILTPFH